MSLEERKNQARTAYLTAREAYMESQTDENWRAFCNAKLVCRRLGVLV